jgi:prevent-host-death family protein
MKMASKKTYGAEEARANLPELLDRAHEGRPTVITKRGRPYAALVPIDGSVLQRKRASLLALKGSGKGLWGKSAKATIAAMRDEWE